MNAAEHDAEILDQFTKQADPFVRRHAHTNEALLGLMADCAALRPEHTLLDVACGPGIVSCFFAKQVARVTGLDMVPAMLERARRFQAEQQVRNVEWKLGASDDLPFPDDSFDRVVTRFSFHHFLEPETVIREMKRVSKPGGVVLVCDVAPSPQAQASFNGWEVLRDPSHTRALTQAEFEAIGKNAGLESVRAAQFRLDMQLEDLLGGSFPKAGNAARIRGLFEEEIRSGTDNLGVAARNENGAVWLSYPLAVLAWRK